MDGKHSHSADDVKMQFAISRILIVDDNSDILKLVSKMAQLVGYRHTTAEDAVDALHYLAKAHYDLVITDYDMPFMDGYQLADQIKKKYLGTRVIIMTGRCERDVTDKLEGSGIVDGLLLKPFNLNTMKEKIQLAGNSSI